VGEQKELIWQWQKKREGEGRGGRSYPREAVKVMEELVAQSLSWTGVAASKIELGRISGIGMYIKRGKKRGRGRKT